MPYSQLLTFQADGATLLQLVAPCGTRRLSPATILSTVGFHQRLDLGLHLRAARDCHLPAAGVLLVGRGFATGTGRSHFPEGRFGPVYEKHIGSKRRPLQETPRQLPTTPIRSPADTPSDTPSSKLRCAYALAAFSRLIKFTVLRSLRRGDDGRAWYRPGDAGHRPAHARAG